MNADNVKIEVMDGGEVVSIFTLDDLVDVSCGLQADHVRVSALAGAIMFDAELSGGEYYVKAGLWQRFKAKMARWLMA